MHWGQQGGKGASFGMGLNRGDGYKETESIGGRWGDKPNRSKTAQSGLGGQRFQWQNATFLGTEKTFAGPGPAQKKKKLISAGLMT